MELKDIKEKVRTICDIEDIFIDEMKPHEKVQFAFKVSYPPRHAHPKNMIIMQGKGKYFISIELATKISPAHMEAFKKMEEQGGANLLPFFFHLLRNMLVNRNLLYNFNLKNQSYVISEQVYEDGLTMDNFYRNLRRVYFASISAQMIINDVVSGKFKGIRLPSTKMGTAEDETGSPEDLYYS